MAGTAGIPGGLLQPGRLGSQSSPALRAAPDAPKHEGGELNTSLRQSTAGNRTSPLRWGSGWPRSAAAEPQSTKTSHGS